MNINVQKPLKRGKLILVEGGRKMLILFKYERLPDFCYCCRRIDRQEMDCPLAVSMQKANMKSHMEFGPWMRAKGPIFML